jgi:hypothetical protein
MFADFLLIVGPWLLALVLLPLLLWVRLRTGRETPLRPAQPSHCRLICIRCQGAEVVTDWTGPQVRDIPCGRCGGSGWDPGDPDEHIDFESETEQALALTRSDPVCLRRLRLHVGDGRQG